MAVNSANPIQLNKVNPTGLNNTIKDKENIDSDFGKILTNAIKDVSKLQSEAKIATEQLVTGQTEDIHSVMIAVEKAEIGLEYTMAIRNKIIDAYNEIMRMQV